jgi:hypothetical protein
MACVASNVNALELVVRQYFQMLEAQAIKWPASVVFKAAEVQAWMYENIFSAETSILPQPPDHYRVQILKQIVSKIEAVVTDSDDDVGPTLLQLHKS